MSHEAVRRRTAVGRAAPHLIEPEERPQGGQGRELLKHHAALTYGGRLCGGQREGSPHADDGEDGRRDDKLLQEPTPRVAARRECGCSRRRGRSARRRLARVLTDR